MRRQMTYTSSVFLARILLPAILIGASTVAALEVGEQAPDFTLPSMMGEKVSLSQFRGKKLVLVEFFIAAASRTGTWSKNLSTRKVDYSKFQELNVQNLGINVDTPFAQKTWANSLELPFPVLSDFPDLRVIRSYGVVQHLGDPPRPFARRSFFLIDKQGIVRGKWLAENKEVFPSEPILKLAREIAGES